MAHAMPDSSPGTIEEEESDNINIGNDDADRRHTDFYRQTEVDSKLEKRKKQLSELIDTGFVIFIAHKLEELLQDLLANVITWCPDYLLHLKKIYGFNFLQQGNDESLQLQYQILEWEEAMNSPGLFESLKRSGDEDEKMWKFMERDSTFKQVWEEKVKPHIRQLNQDSLSPREVEECVKRGINKFVEDRSKTHILDIVKKLINDRGPEDIRIKIDDILDGFKLSLGDLIKEVEACHNDLGISLDKVRSKDVRIPDAAQMWLRIIDRASPQEGELHRRLTKINEVRNRIYHHGKSRPCLILETSERDLLTEYYDSITKSELTTFSEMEREYDEVNLADLRSMIQTMQSYSMERKQLEDSLAEEKRRRMDLEKKFQSMRLLMME